MVRLTPEQMKYKQAEMREYVGASNAATGSRTDSNANVAMKNVSTLQGNMWKDFSKQLKRQNVSDIIADMFGADLAAEYNRQIETHEIYVHDESLIAKPYCGSFSMYPFLLHGMTKLGGESGPPKKLSSFCGGFINLCFALSSQVGGAIALTEMLLAFDHFARKDLGEDYMVRIEAGDEAAKKVVDGHLQQLVYSLNQPASARDYESLFFNTSVFCKYYMEAIFGDFMFPDGSRPNFDSWMRLQKHYLRWFNAERTRALLTFPVNTVAILHDGEKPRDADFADFIAGEISEGNGFFTYMSESADSLASCCRLRNEVLENVFNSSIGLTGVMTGSMNVIAININRFVQENKDNYLEALREQVRKTHKYQVATYRYLEHLKNSGLMPIYDAGFISMDKQFLTIGLNGVAEAAEFLGLEISYNPEYIKFLQDFLKVIYDENKAAKQQYGLMFNTEFVPAENQGVKNAAKDKELGYFSPRDCYNSYIFLAEDENISIIDKMRLHGKEIVKYLDGGSACHIALEEYPTKEACLKMLNLSAKTGCNYFCTNVKITCCEDCLYIDKNTLQACSKCGSRNISHATRIIGYLKKIKSFAEARQKEEAMRFYHKTPSTVISTTAV